MTITNQYLGLWESQRQIESWPSVPTKYIRLAIHIDRLARKIRAGIPRSRVREVSDGNESLGLDEEAILKVYSNKCLRRYKGVV